MYCEDIDGSKWYGGEHNCYFCNRAGTIHIKLPVLENNLAFICHSCRRAQLEMSTRMIKWTPIHIKLVHIPNFVITSREDADRFLRQLIIEGLIDELTEHLVLKRLSGDDWP